MSQDSIQWIGFNLFVVLMLILDLGVFHRKSNEIKIREALVWTIIWIGLAVIFGIGVQHFQGDEKALEFFTGYLIEKSLSVDNIFVMYLIFSYFNVPPPYQHKVLFWGILGALILRVLFIFAGVAIIQKFHWAIYVFALFLLFTGIKMLRNTETKVDPEKSFLVRAFRRFFPVTKDFRGNKFFVKENRVLYATPLFLVVLVIEMTDLVFAVDSIPAILAVSQDQFIVYTSNVFAILGLRSLYFALAGLNKYFRYLKYGLACILIFVGAKMFVSHFYKIPIFLALIIVAGILIVSVIASIIAKKKVDEENLST